MVQLSPPADTNNSIDDSVLATATLDVQGMKCAGCVSAVERQLAQNPGVVSACVNLVTEVAVVKYQEGEIEPQILAEKLTTRGFPSQVRSSADSFRASARLTAAQRHQQAEREQIWGLSVAAILLFFSAIGHWRHISGQPVPYLSNIWFHWALATLALLIPGRHLIVDGWRSLRHGMPNMNTLVGLGTCSAYFTSFAALLFPNLGWECFFDEPVMLLGFILLGRTLEGKARHRASAALEALVSLQPAIAYLLGKPDQIDQSGIEIPVEQVRVGEWLKILPGEKIPVDGIVTAGTSTVDESLLTGESLPVFKQTGDNAIAGTINQSGVLVIQATRIGEDTTLAQIIASVEEAQTRKAPIQQLADTVAGYFAYGVMAIALMTFCFWEFLGTRLFPSVLTVSMGHHLANNMADMEPMMAMNPTLLSLKLAIAVLVIACPCALGLATPTAILVGTGMGAEQGLLIKGGDILEKTKQLTTLVFDKTGTLTLGHPSVTDCLPLNGFDESKLLQLAATVEQGTNHPLAAAISSAAQAQEISLLEADNFHTEPGLGVKAQVQQQTILLGNEIWLAQHQVEISSDYQPKLNSLLQAGKTLVYIALNNQLIGILALQDQLRPDAQTTVKQLQNLGLETVLLTGDQPLVANAIAEQVGIQQIFSQVQPAQKVATIQSLQASGKTVGMIGDGINDAPALAQADIGVSLKGATEVAMETADIVLMRSQLSDIVAAIDLSTATVKKIQQNLVYALGYNIVAIPIAAGLLLPRWGFVLSPAIAGGLMALSSIIVVTNSLTLRRHSLPSS